MTKRISINALEKVMKETYDNTHMLDWHGLEVTIKKTLSLKEMLEFVNSVVNSCFSNDEISVYNPEVKDFAIKISILQKYTNFTLPKNSETKYELLYKTDVIPCVLKCINAEQFFEICTSIDKKIENVAQANIEAVNKQMVELMSAFENLQTQMGELFDGVENSDMPALLKALSGGTLDEDKFVQAFINRTNMSNAENGE